MKNLNEKISILNTANYVNGYNPLIPYPNSIGYRPNALRYANRNEYKSLAEDFLINSYTVRNDIENQASLESYTCDAELKLISMLDNRFYDEKQTIKLPKSIPLDLSLGEAIVKRRSIRHYTGDKIELAHLATALRACYGISGEINVRSNTGNLFPIKVRTVPSGGGLYSYQIYIVSLAINKLPVGIYEYIVNKDILYQVDSKDIIDNLIRAYTVTDDAISISRANYLILFVATPWKSMRKYGSKGLRFALQELGAISQSFHLTMVALGLGSTDCAAYCEDEMNAVLGFDGVNQSVLHTVIAGVYS